MSEEAYSSNPQPVGEWQPILVTTRDKEGFDAVLYRRGNDYVFATQGSEGAGGDRREFREDLRANIQQSLGHSEQYHRSIAYARQLSQELWQYRLTFVGHSKGGGQAIANARATGREAIVFNPSSVSRATAKKEQLGKGGKIERHINRGELLHLARQRLGRLGALFFDPMESNTADTYYQPLPNSNPIDNHILNSFRSNRIGRAQ